MRIIPPLLALVLCAGSLQAQEPALTVMRHAPRDTATPGNVVTVTFDRPVAGRLDGTIPAGRVMRIEPAVAGEVAWRDPVTIRFVPSEPLAPGAEFEVVVDTIVEAIDGSRLAAPYRFSFRVPGPRLLERSFGRGDARGVLPPDGRVLLLYSAPVDSARLAAGAAIALRNCAGGARKVALRVTRQRPVATDDPYHFQVAGGWDRDTVGDRFRRVVELEPAAPLPTDCMGLLELPTTAADASHGTIEGYGVATAPAFRIVPPSCDPVRRCPVDHLDLSFSVPVAREALERHVRLEPAGSLDLGTQRGPAATWRLPLRLAPRTTYTVVTDDSLRDVHGRLLTGAHRVQVVTGDYEPAIGHAVGLVTMPRTGAGAFPLRHVNVRAVRIVSYRFPQGARARALASAAAQLDTTLFRMAYRPDTTLVSLEAPLNEERTTEVPLPARALESDLVALLIEALPDTTNAARERGARGLAPVIVRARSPYERMIQFPLLQRTGLAVHAKAGPEGVMALVTGLDDGRPRAGATVRQLDGDGLVIAEGVTGADGTAALRRQDFTASVAGASVPRTQSSGAIEAMLDGDRVVSPLPVRMLGFRHTGPLDPAGLGGHSERPPATTATLFTDRGIYRPGEMLYLTGVVREGSLHALRVPTRGDSVRVVVRHDAGGRRSDEDVVVRDTVLRLTAFGTVSDSIPLGRTLPLGRYVAELSYDGQPVAEEWLRVAEYRAPEFLVDARADSTPRFGGDTVRVQVAGRYLFGAPMGRGAVQWTAQLHEVPPWEIRIPGAEGWTVGEFDWSAWRGGFPALRQFDGHDSLDARGAREIRVPLDNLRPTRPGRVEVSVAVTDINRQVITTSTSVAVHPARLYVLARRQSRGWYWTAGQPATIAIRTVHPDGRESPGVAVVASLVRREWRGSMGGWADSVLRTDTIRTGARAASFSFVPAVAGEYQLRLSAPDGHGATAHTTLDGYAIAPGARWGAGNPFHLALVAEKRPLSVGDSAAVFFDSPFDLAEAWITLEREGILEARRMLVRRGPATIPLRIGEAHVPNLFVSVLLVRRQEEGAPARPDSAAQLVRAGYVELEVRPDVKRLAVALIPRAKEYGPGDSAAVRVRLSDASGGPVRGEVTVWAVDEGVLALTGFETPDLVSRLYGARGLGSALTSTLPSILTANPGFLLSLEGYASRVAMGVSLSAVLAREGEGVPAVAFRTRLRSTAFHVATLRTDARGEAELRAKLPDNLSTYRVMAVAVDSGGRFGRGDTAVLITRPLVARPTLPRFVRASDTLLAGAAVNVRDGGARDAAVDVEAEGVALQGERRRQLSLREGKGAEARFGFVVPPRDSATDSVVVRLRASDGRSADAVEVRLPVQPDFHARTHTEIGMLRDSALVSIALPAGTDPARSRLTVRVGTSALPAMLAAYERLRDYPWSCAEQVASEGRALVALWRVARASGRPLPDGDPRARLQELADELSRRQRADGAIRYWDDHDWSSPWLSTYVGLFLLEARAEGIVVAPRVVEGIARYLRSATPAAVDTGGTNRHERRARRLALGDRVATVDFLRRLGEPDTDAEARLLALAPLMTWEDRLRLAEVVAVEQPARASGLLDAAWRAVTRAGRRVDLPDSAFTDREFPSHVAPAARLLLATLALGREHPLTGGLVETVLQVGRAEGRWAWSTQDYASVVLALAAIAPAQPRPREARVAHDGRTLLVAREDSMNGTSSIPLDGLLERGADGRPRLRLSIAADGRGVPVYYAVSVEEVPSSAPVTPDIQGIVVERWYERFADGRPVTTVQEGELVRVRLRVTVPADRQFVSVVDPLPAGLEPVDLRLRTTGTLQPFVTPASDAAQAEGDRDRDGPGWQAWLYGSWDDGWWSPWEHKAMHDDKVVYFARMLWKGSYTASYVARATTAGSFVRPPAHAEEMYNPALQGRSDGGRFGVVEKQP